MHEIPSLGGDLSSHSFPVLVVAAVVISFRLVWRQQPWDTEDCVDVMDRATAIVTGFVITVSCVFVSVLFGRYSAVTFGAGALVSILLSPLWKRLTTSRASQSARSLHRRDQVQRLARELAEAEAKKDT